MRRPYIEENKLKRIKSGISGLDDMFNGGIIKGSRTLFSGQSGTGKTILSLQFIKEGLKLNEKCVYISLLEDPKSSLQYYNIVNVDWNYHLKNKDLFLVYINPSGIKKLEERLLTIMNTSEIQRIVIDGFSGMVKERAYEDIYKVLMFIQKKGISCIVTTSDFERRNTGGNTSPLPELVDNVVILKQLESEGDTARTINILKAKGTFYDTKTRQVIIGKNGIAINKIPLVDNSSGKKVISDTEIKYHLWSWFLKDEMLKDFKNANPNIVINKMEEIGSRHEIQNSLAVQNTPLGVIGLSFQELCKPALDNQLMSLDDSITKDMYFKGALEACTINGQVYGIPDDVDSRHLFYRKDLLNKYGITPPETWQELIDAAKYIVKGEKDPKLNGLLAYWSHEAILTGMLFETIWGNNGDIYDSEGISIVNSKRAEEALQLMKDLIYIHKIMPKEIIHSFSTPTVADMFRNCESVFNITKCEFMFSQYKKDDFYKEKVGIAPLPKMQKDAAHYNIIRGNALCVPKNTRYPKSANAFLKYITSMKVSRQFEIDGGWPFPAKTAFWEDKEILKAKPFYAGAKFLLKNYKNPYADINNFDIIFNLAKNNITKVMREEKEPAEMLEHLSKEISLLSKHHKTYSKVVENIMSCIKENYDKVMSLENIAKEVRLSPSHVGKVFKMETGSTIFDYVVKVKMDKAKEFLSDIRYNIGEVAAKTGYTDTKYFAKLFKKQTGHTPSEYRLM
ncbi:MAG: hypothetical protein A2452_12840 [Candidatus Firestonebacteria bacterium RIFOXYC2_FULL_39_67]|nr:MAG: hypothetical protein A2536_12205 [Candidatus Firestonebacteria bacterium RIFOXYD2_FULL_39_29]OGF57449.1 MAG: hypothetical protein A2452_12840 [Candidatus Firestonebacteria bacterium RIFOXYC2_FULL_39_67]